LKRRVLRIGAILGAATVSTLAIAPAFAAAATSQATAQSLHISIAGTDAVSQKVTATNDGSGESKNNASTLPTIAGLFPGNNLLGAGVAPQDAGANSDGTSFACAGIAGTGSDGAIVNTGKSACNIDGQPLTLDLANLDLGSIILSDDSALGAALNNIPGIGALLQTLGVNLDALVDQIDAAVGSTPLGELSLGGSLSAIEGVCTANPDSATGDANIVDSSGGSNQTPIDVTLPGVADPIVVANFPANPPPNTHVLVDLDDVTATLITALETEIDTAVGGALSGLNLGVLLDTIQDQVVAQLVAQLQPLLQPLQDNLLDITLNKQVVGNGGRSIDVVALDAQVLPAAQQFTGSSLISGQIGEVTCGPNTRATTTTGGGDTANPSDNGDLPDIPTVVDSGLAGHQNHTGRDVLGATAALMLLAGTAGLLGYRRMLNK
jgi:hypothetical protein